MIVPRNRLLWIAALLFPVSLFGLALEDGSLVVLLALFALAAIALGDLVWARGRGELVRIKFPDVVRLTKNRDEAIPLELEVLRPTLGIVRIGLTLPAELGDKQDDLWAPVGEAGTYDLTWPCRPVRRGLFRVRRVHWEVASPLGLWGMPGSHGCEAEVRVYPDLSRERKTMAAFFLNRGMFGLHAHRMVGRGREFERLREYMPGDSYDEIHWKATARRGSPISKVFQVERTQEVYVIIDSSRLTARNPARGGEGAERTGEPDETVLERFVSAALVLGLAAEKQGDRFGLLAFGGGVTKFIRAGSGKGHFNACRDALYTLQPEPVSPDLNEIFTFLRLRLRKRALLFFLTSLEDQVVEETFTSHIDLLARKHLVMVNMLRPVGVDRLFSGREIPGSQEEFYDRLAGHMRWHDIRETGKKLHRYGVQFSLLENERLSPELISQYMMVKQRQLV